VFSVQVFKFLTLILPLFNFSIFCFFCPLHFVIIHMLLKPFLPPGHKINFSNNVIRNTTQIKKYNDKIRLFISLSNLLGFHISIVVHFIFMTIFNQMLSIINESTNIVELSTVFWIRKNVIPWGTLTRLLWIQNFFQLYNCVRVCK
jgi:hypothetical protein